MELFKHFSSSLTLMPPIPASEAIPNPGFKGPLLHRRMNLNPLHWATLPLRNNWDSIGPALSKYNDATRLVSILLGTIGMVIMLETHQWKLPRWPWAKDGKNKPLPSFVHENERYTIDQLTEQKLIEMLKEMKMNEDNDELPLPEEIPGPLDQEEDDAALREAEEQFMDDAREGVGDVVREAKGAGVLG
jgi:hypothetical protein